MYRVPPDRAWWLAVGVPLERRVRRLSHKGQNETNSLELASGYFFGGLLCNGGELADGSGELADI